MSARWAIGCVLLLAATACGGRPVLTGDGAAVAPGDGPTRNDGRVLLDGPARNSCLPIQAGQVAGRYEGSFKGTWRCPGDPVQSISGYLDLQLSPAGAPESFDVSGSMYGTVQGNGVLMYNAKLSGSTGCAGLSAKLPSIKVGGGWFILIGTMQGTFGVTSGGKLDFPSGSWTAQQGGSQPCKASGSWFASWVGVPSP